jgi:hypothetical protein
MIDSSPHTSHDDVSAELKFRFLKEHEQLISARQKTSVWYILHMLVWASGGYIFFSWKAALSFAGISASLSLLDFFHTKYWRAPKVEQETERLRNAVLNSSPVPSVAFLKPAKLYRERICIRPEQSEIEWRGEIKLPDRAYNSGFFEKEIQCLTYFDPESEEPQVVEFPDFLVRLINAEAIKHSAT